MHQCANHPPPDHYGRAFLIGILLNISFVIVEGIFGFATDSLALLADAGHNLSDVLGLLIAWGGYLLAKLPSTTRHTFGWRGATILAALFNGILLMIAVLGISWEAFHRLETPAEVNPKTMILVAMVGVFINTGTALLFSRGRKSDLNLRGVYLHMAADALLSVGVVVAGILIQITGLLWIDPCISLIIALVIFAGTWGLLRDSFHLAIHAVPKSIDPNHILNDLENLPSVKSVHDLHIWAISTTETCLTAHILVGQDDDSDTLLRSISTLLHDRYQILHTTIQIEHDRNPLDGKV